MGVLIQGFKCFKRALSVVFLKGIVEEIWFAMKVVGQKKIVHKEDLLLLSIQVFPYHWDSCYSSHR